MNEYTRVSMRVESQFNFVYTTAEWKIIASKLKNSSIMEILQQNSTPTLSVLGHNIIIGSSNCISLRSWIVKIAFHLLWNRDPHSLLWDDNAAEPSRQHWIQKNTYHIRFGREYHVVQTFQRHPFDGHLAPLLVHTDVVLLLIEASRQSKVRHFHRHFLVDPGTNTSHVMLYYIISTAIRLCFLFGMVN